MSIEVPRRRFLLGLAGLIAAPAIVKVASLMPLRGQLLTPSSLQKITSYDVDDDAIITRLDVLYVKFLFDPRWDGVSLSELPSVYSHRNMTEAEFAVKYPVQTAPTLGASDQ